jgi:hypothetical protein
MEINVQGWIWHQISVGAKLVPSFLPKLVRLAVFLSSELSYFNNNNGVMFS